MSSTESHKAGFINIIGLPNAGKSTLTNALIGWNLTVVNRKPQTTRHRIHAIINGPDHQIIIADTPGYIKNPEYAMQESMNKAALSVTDDADVILAVHDVTRPFEDSIDLFKEVFLHTDAPVIIVLNKVDLVSDEVVLKQIAQWSKENIAQHIFPLSAKEGTRATELIELVKGFLPEHPAYYDKEDSSDRDTRFFVSEIIRSEILTLYQKEIPYSVQVQITEYQERKSENEKTRISATIFVLRNSQRRILIGRQGSAIKKLGDSVAVK